MCMADSFSGRGLRFVVGELAADGVAITLEGALDGTQQLEGVANRGNELGADVRGDGDAIHRLILGQHDEADAGRARGGELGGERVVIDWKRWAAGNPTGAVAAHDCGD